MPKMTICIPAYNEVANVVGISAQVKFLLATFPDEITFIILNNGSDDETFDQLTKAFPASRNVCVLNSDINLGYGGGMRMLIDAAKTDFVCMLPADLQYTQEDIKSAISIFLKSSETSPGTFVIGKRLIRNDAKSQIFTSKVYSWLVNILWRTPRLDVNALPKIFPKSIMDNYTNFASNFVLDAQIIWVAQQENLDFYAVPVEFLRRSAGISSWSGKRVKMYLTVIKQLNQGPPIIKQSSHL